MPTSSRIVDWNGLSLNDGIRRMASVLRDHLGVRLFVVTLEGDGVDLTPDGADQRSCFDHFVATSARWQGPRGSATALAMHERWAREVQEWTADRLPGETTKVVEHAPGFDSLLTPIVGEDGRVTGAVAVAGWVAKDGAAKKIEAIREMMPEHLKAPSEEGKSHRILQLSRDDQRWVETLARSIAEVFGEQIAAQSSADQTSSGRRFQEMIGQSEPMLKMFRVIEKVADSNSSILITGENGTGKELVARAIHRGSRRRHEPFLAINCAAIPGDLITSELFGHVKGAFSGAHRDRQGVFEAANRGTLLLDEIGDMEASLQSKLLRVLQEGTLVRVGDNEVRKVDVRVLCATNANLEDLVRKGKFRRDLYFRVRVMTVPIAPLRERKGDVELLARHFVSRSCRRHGKPKKTLSATCLEQLARYRWPGNVRELENEIERLVIMTGDEELIEDRWLSDRIRDAEEEVPELDFEGYEMPEAVELLERRMILAGLRTTGWNKSQTARDLGVSRRNLIRKVARYELEKFRDDD